MESNIMFCKTFVSKGTKEEILGEINGFLSANGYEEVKPEEFDETGCYRDYPVFILPVEESDDLIVYLERDLMAETQVGFLTNELTKFRDERDWNQFHNPKDLAIALSIEANELLEQYLWKQPEEANIEKVEKELADVFAYAFLLADKLQLDVEEILLRKIRHNGAGQEFFTPLLFTMVRSKSLLYYCSLGTLNIQRIPNLSRQTPQ